MEDVYGWSAGSCLGGVVSGKDARCHCAKSDREDLYYCTEKHGIYCGDGKAGKDFK